MKTSNSSGAPLGASGRGNIGWVDALRVIACFLVVFAHCCDPYVASFNTDYNTFLQGTAMGSLVRCCVPLFVMMSGVLLFPVRTGMAEFYKKRLGRILVPLVFWSVALPLMYFVYLNYMAVTDNPCINGSAYTWEMTLTKYILSFLISTMIQRPCGISICYWGFILLSRFSAVGSTVPRRRTSGFF